MWVQLCKHLLPFNLGSKPLQTTVADAQKRCIDSPSLQASLAVQTAAVRAMLAMVTATDEIQFCMSVPVPSTLWMRLYTWDSKVRKPDQLKMILGQGLYTATPGAQANMGDLYICELPTLQHCGPKHTHLHKERSFAVP